MPGLRFRDRVVVFVGIVLCAVSDAFKRLVTREKPDIGPVWDEDAHRLEQQARFARIRVHLDQMKAAEDRIRELTFPVPAGAVWGDRVLGTDGLWHDKPDVVQRLKEDLDRKHSAQMVHVAAMESELNTYLAADKAERVKGYDETEPIDFFPPGTYHSNKQTEPSKEQDWDF